MMGKRSMWKFPLSLGETSVLIPAGHQLRRVGMQFDIVTVWAEVDTESPSVYVRFVVVGTGHPIPDWAYKYVGTVDDRSFVWHVFADTNMSPEGVFS